MAFLGGNKAVLTHRNVCYPCVEAPPVKVPGPVCPLRSVSLTQIVAGSHVEATGRSAAPRAGLHLLNADGGGARRCALGELRSYLHGQRRGGGLGLVEGDLVSHRA